MKDLKIISSKPPTQKHLIEILSKEAIQTRQLAFSVLRKLPKEVRPLTTIILRSAVPTSKHGKSLADIRNELSRTRVCLHELSTFLNNSNKK